MSNPSTAAAPEPAPTETAPVASSPTPSPQKVSSESAPTLVTEPVTQPKTEPAKTEDVKTDSATKEAPDAKPAEPVKFELKLPDGSLLNDKHVEATVSFAKEQGLTQTQAQAILEKENAALAGLVESQIAGLKQTSTTEWVEQVRSDKEIGGDHFNRSVESAKRVVERFGTDAFKTALNQTGLGNHPELVRCFARIAQSMSEDQLVLPGSQSGSSKKAIEDVFYGGTK